MITIIPAIDIIDGACVRLKQGDYTQKQIYSLDPLATAQRFYDLGARRLHLVDLDGAKAGRVVNSPILAQLAAIPGLDIDFGGGIQSDQDIESAFACGAKQVNCGTIAVKQKALFLTWLKKYGSDAIILSADVRGELVSVSGWQEQTKINIFALLDDYVAAGLKWLCCTDIGRDGMNSGPSLELYKTLVGRYPLLSVISSGGVSSIDDVRKLEDAGLTACIIGRALYDGLIDPRELFARFAPTNNSQEFEVSC